MLILHKLDFAEILLSLLFVIMFNGYVHAQADISTVSLKGGIIRNYQLAVGENAYDAYTFLPELEFGGNFFLAGLKWGVSFGYWNNNVDPNIFRDYFPNSFKSVLLTPKLYYSLIHESRFKASILAGVSYQIVTTSPLYEINLYGDRVEEKTRHVIEPILGTQFGYMLNESVGIFGEIDYHLMNRNKYDINQTEAKILFSYNFQ